MTVLTYVPCQCSKCKDRKMVPGTVCPCPECQPGPGLDRPPGIKPKSDWDNRRLKTRMLLLIHKDILTDTEECELDRLLDWYIKQG